MNSPLESAILFQIGPVPITQAVVTTWVIMLVLVLGAYFLTRRIGTVPRQTPGGA
jgi:F-type H+-transporting ATPase subunit a